MQNKVRIIAGNFRGRKIPVLDTEGLRPTGDRVRETLFAWLSPYIHNSVCLDLFAGSGVLSFEALSRGAAKTILIDQSKQIVMHLKKIAAELKITNCEIIHAQLPGAITLPEKSIDIVFIDPPFRQNLIEPICNWLDKTSWLKPQAHIYLEMEKSLKNFKLPENWHIEKAKTAGQTAFYLVKYA